MKILILGSGRSRSMFSSFLKQWAVANDHEVVTEPVSPTRMRDSSPIIFFDECAPISEAVWKTIKPKRENKK